MNSLGESGEFGRGEFAWWLNEEEKEAVKNHPEGPPCLERYKRYCENPPGSSKLTREVLREFNMRQTGTLKTVSTTSDQDVGKPLKEIMESNKCRICGKSCSGPQSLQMHWEMSGKCKKK